jgi:pimeloyl-ACP methyl ester carboxylesterase
MRHRILSSVTVFFFILFFTSSYAQVLTARSGVSMIANSGGYYEYLPQGYSTGNQSYPLLILLHGIGEIGDGSAAELPALLQYGPEHLIEEGVFPTSFTVNGQTFSFIIIVPQFIGWPTNTDVDSVIDFVEQNYRVDQSRIYLTGLSMGGGAVWEYAGYGPPYVNRIAAIVPISGADYPWIGRANAIAAGDLPVWATHNDSDQTVPSWYTIDYVNEINASPVPPNPLAQMTIFHSYSHDAWDTTYSLNFKENGLNIYEWMLQFQRNFTNYWTGAISSAWENPGNWSLNIVPDKNTDVVVNAGTIIVSSNATVKSLSLSPGVSFTVSVPYNFTIDH